MRDFQYYTPTKVLFGRNTEEKERLLQNVKNGWKLLNQQLKELAVCQEEESSMLAEYDRRTMEMLDQIADLWQYERYAKREYEKCEERILDMIADI